jgi:hypothetical protein
MPIAFTPPINCVLKGKFSFVLIKRQTMMAGRKVEVRLSRHMYLASTLDGGE